MSKKILPTNFRDDIMNASMNSKRQYNLILNLNGTTSLEDVTEYDQIGSKFGSANVNAISEAVNESADKNKIIDNVDELMITTSLGYMAGAKAVAEMNKIYAETLPQGQKELVISNSNFKNNCIYSFYTDQYGYSPKSVEATDGNVKLTFSKAASRNILVGVKIDGKY